MSNDTLFLSVSVAILFAIAMVAMPVSAAGPGKLAVPGNSGVWNYGGTTEDTLKDIAVTQDGGSVLIVETDSTNYDLAGLPSLGLEDIWVVKLDKGNSIQWSRRFGGSGSESPSSIQQTTDGGYIFIAETQSTDNNVTGNHGGFDIWVVKLTDSGNIDWQRCFGSSGEEYALCITETIDGGYILAGIALDNGGDITGHHGGSSGNRDAWIVKLDLAGMIVWQKCLGGSDDDQINRIIPTRDGAYLLVGFTESDDGYITGHHGAVGTRDLWVVKLSEDGMVMWQKCLGGTNNDVGSSGIEISDGGYVIVGSTSSKDGDVSGNHWAYMVTTDVWVVCLDPNGAIEWQRCLGGEADDVGRCILPALDGGYTLLGETWSTNDDVSTPYNPGPYTEDAWIIRLDNAGSPLWQKCLGGTNYDSGIGILDTPDGGYLVGMVSRSNDGESTSHHYGAKDVLLVKLYAPPLLNGIAPNRVTAGTNPTIVITGENLVQGILPATVKLIKPGTPDITLPVNQFSLLGTYLQCQPATDTFVTPGNYTLRVMTNDSQHITVPDAFTVTCGPAPKLTSMTPTSAIQGTPLNAVTIKGSGFWTSGGITAYLNRTGQPNIAITVTSGSATQLNGNFIVPAGAATGKWNLVVRNPDGQYAMKKDAFTVNLRTFKPPRVSSVTPRTVTTGNKTFINGILGNFFNASASVAMTGPRSVAIPISNVTVLSETKITCDADLTAIPKGYATVTVTNPDGKKSTRARAFVIR